MRSIHVHLQQMPDDIRDDTCDAEVELWPSKRIRSV